MEVCGHIVLLAKVSSYFCIDWVEIVIHLWKLFITSLNLFSILPCVHIHYLGLHSNMHVHCRKKCLVFVGQYSIMLTFLSQLPSKIFPCVATIMRFIMSILTWRLLVLGGTHLLSFCPSWVCLSLIFCLFSFHRLNFVMWAPPCLQPVFPIRFPV